MLIEIDKLKPHPLAISLVPRMIDLEFQAFLDDIKINGIIDPIEVIPDKNDSNKFIIIDGTHRFAAAKELKFKKVPIVVKNISEEKIRDYIISKAVLRRNMSKSQKAILATELLSQNNNISIKELAKKYGISYNFLKTIIKIKNTQPDVYYLLKTGAIDIEKAIEILKKVKLKETNPIIEEFKNLPEDLKKYIAQIPVEYQESLFNKIFFSVKQDKGKTDHNHNISSEDLTEKNALIQEATEKYMEQKKIANTLKQKYDKLKKQEKILKDLVNKFKIATNELIKQQEFFPIDNPVSKYQISELIAEINQLKEQIEQVSNIKINIENQPNKISIDILKKQTELLSIFMYFADVISDFNINRIKNLLSEPEVLNNKIIYQINNFIEKTETLLNVIQNQLTEILLKQKEKVFNSKEKNYLVLTPMSGGEND